MNLNMQYIDCMHSWGSNIGCHKSDITYSHVCTHMRPHTYTFLPTCVWSRSMQTWENRNQYNTPRIIMLHWNRNVILTKIFVTGCTRSSGVACDDNFVKMMTFQFQCFAATVKLLRHDYLIEQEMPDEESLFSRLNYEEQQPYLPIYLMCLRIVWRTLMPMG